MAQRRGVASVSRGRWAVLAAVFPQEDIASAREGGVVVSHNGRRFFKGTRFQGLPSPGD